MNSNIQSLTDSNTTTTTTTASSNKLQPRLTHLNTAPQLTQIHSDTELITDKDRTGHHITNNNTNNPTLMNNSSTINTSIGDLSNKSKRQQANELFNALRDKQSDNYRFVEFTSNQPTPDIPSKQYTKQVSFDDINIQYDMDDIPDPDDDFGWELYKLKNRDRLCGTNNPGSGSGSGGGGANNNSLPGYLVGSSIGRGRGLGRGRDTLRTPSPLGNAGASSRLSPSPNRTSLNYEDLDLETRLDIAQLIQYPSTPITTKRFCTLKKSHKQFDQLYKDQLYRIIRPMFRTILVYVSGRIHTWVALDWILSKFIEDGDHVIIIASINPCLLSGTNKDRSRRATSRTRMSLSPAKIGSQSSVIRGNTLSPQRSRTDEPQSTRQDSIDPFIRLKEKSRPENIVKIAHNLMDYVMKVINPKIIARITVELVEGDTKEVLQDMYRLYEPNLVCTGAKPNARMGAPLRSWQSSKLTDRLIKNFPLPVIAVPAVNMCQFEYNLQNKLNGTIDAKEVDQQNQLNALNNIMETSEINKKAGDESESGDDDENDARSITSSVSISSDESYDSFIEVADVYLEHKQDLRKNLQHLQQSQPINENYYSDMVKLISDESVELCEEIISIQPNFIGNGAKLAREITGSNSFGNVPYKTKSMLEPQHNDSTSNGNDNGSGNNNKPSLSFKELKEQLKLNKIKTELAVDTPVSGSTSSLGTGTEPTTSSSPPQKPDLQPPLIKIDVPSPSPTTTTTTTTSSGLPPSSETSLRFGNLEKPSIERRKKPSMLHKCLSHSDDSVDRPKLEARKSHPDVLEHIRDEIKPSSKDKKTKKKKKKFLGIF